MLYSREMARTSHIGIYAGTFDPIHPGHVAFAQEAMRVCKLDKVVFLPEREPRGKHGVTGHSHRAALIKLAVESIPGFEVLELSTPRFTIKDTLPTLQRLYRNAELTFLLGSDVAESLHNWEHVNELLSSASLVIGLRKGGTPEELTALMYRLGQNSDLKVRYALISAANAAMTSSQIRRNPQSLRKPSLNTYRYITEHNLYRAA